MKRRFLKRLKFVPTINSLKQGLVFQLNPSQKIPVENFQNPPICKEQDTNRSIKDGETEPEIVVRETENIAAPSLETSVNQMEEAISLSDFEEKCPPGGQDSVILYTTSLRSIRKTFEDCKAITFLLQSFKVLFHERDVSMDLNYREELWALLGGRVIPPRLFIKGKYVGGADEVVGLHEQGKLKKLLEGLPVECSNCPCRGCGNMRFVVCLNCNGSCRVYASNEEVDDLWIKCPECNENGLVKCSICC